MKFVPALLVTCLVAISAYAQSTGHQPQTIQQQIVQSYLLYDQHSYAAAASILEKLPADPEATSLPDWPDTLYNLACDQALEGKPAQAMLTLTQAVDLGSSSSAAHIREDTDLVSLHNNPQFQALLARIVKQEALWRDDPAIATPYKPALSEDEKVAGLSKFWSEARFNFPFFARLPDLDWDRLYMDYLPQVRAAQTTADYYRVMMRFAASLHDGHTSVSPPDKLSNVLSAQPAFDTQLIEDKVLVTGIYDPALAAQGIRVGAEIVTIDGQPVREYAEKLVTPYVSSSTKQLLDLDVYTITLFNGPRQLPINLTLRDANGETISATVHRYCEPTSKCVWPGEQHVQFKMLPGNIAYLAVNEFMDDIGAETMRENFAAISQAKALIVDVRENGGGSSQNGYAILSMLSAKPFQNSSARMLDYKPTYRALGEVPGWFTVPASAVNPDPAHLFSGPVIVLIGAETGSAAEDFAVAFDAIRRGTLLGEPTGGSTGQPLVFQLPGGGSARICTKDDTYPDGRAIEGVGVLPQVKVSPTVSDIRQGKDAALDRALEILSATNSTH
jgi:C-terminal processing protease CtpA/Prc